MLLSQTFSRPIVPNHLALTPSQPTTGIFAPLKCYTASRFLFAFDSDEAKKNQWPIRKVRRYGASCRLAYGGVGLAVAPGSRTVLWAGAWLRR
ncbi:hypothetical protein V6Z12_A10G081000 [Gossypium hirsutum]